MKRGILKTIKKFVKHGRENSTDASVTFTTLEKKLDTMSQIYEKSGNADELSVNYAFLEELKTCSDITDRFGFCTSNFQPGNFNVYFTI